MRPNIDKDLQISYGLLGGLTVVGLIVLAVFADWGELAGTLDDLKENYDDDDATLPMDEQVALRAKVNQELALSIEERKQQVGLRETMPFVMPTETNKFGWRFQRVYLQVADKLRIRARNQRIRFDEDIGFKFLDGQRPANEDARQYLIMLQLISKAVYLATHSPENEITAVEVPTLSMARSIRLAGPADRKTPLVREYHFRIEVEGTLRELLWLMHQVSIDYQPTLSKEEDKSPHAGLQKWLASITREVLTEQEINTLSNDRAIGNDVCPLVVTDCRIESDNKTQSDGIGILRLKLDLAGMEFLGPEVQWEGRGRRNGTSRRRTPQPTAKPMPKPRPPAASGGGRRNIGNSSLP